MEQRRKPPCEGEESCVLQKVVIQMFSVEKGARRIDMYAGKRSEMGPMHTFIQDCFEEGVNLNDDASASGSQASDAARKTYRSILQVVIQTEAPELQHRAILRDLRDPRRQRVVHVPHDEDPKV